jgi:hypothetical protein
MLFEASSSTSYLLLVRALPNFHSVFALLLHRSLGLRASRQSAK